METRLLVETYLNVNWWKHDFLSYLFNELDASILCGSIINLLFFCILFSLEERLFFIYFGYSSSCLMKMIYMMIDDAG